MAAIPPSSPDPDTVTNRPPPDPASPKSPASKDPAPKLPPTADSHLAEFAAYLVQFPMLKQIQIMTQLSPALFAGLFISIYVLLLSTSAVGCECAYIACVLHPLYDSFRHITPTNHQSPRLGQLLTYWTLFGLATIANQCHDFEPVTVVGHMFFVFLWCPRVTLLAHWHEAIMAPLCELLVDNVCDEEKWKKVSPTFARFLLSLNPEKICIFNVRLRGQDMKDWIAALKESIAVSVEREQMEKERQIAIAMGDEIGEEQKTQDDEDDERPRRRK